MHLLYTWISDSSQILFFNFFLHLLPLKRSVISGNSTVFVNKHNTMKCFSSKQDKQMYTIVSTCRPYIYWHIVVFPEKQIKTISLIFLSVKCQLKCCIFKCTKNNRVCLSENKRFSFVCVCFVYQLIRAFRFLAHFSAIARGLMSTRALSWPLKKFVVKKGVANRKCHTHRRKPKG